MSDNKLKILIIDDEDSLRLSLASILELEGYEVKTAEDGFKAIELAKQESFNIIFSDIRMPGMSGTDTFKEIKKIRPDVVGVMMTAYAMNDLIVDALNSGAFACISKPFEIDAILSTIKDILARPFVVVIDKNSNLDNKFLKALQICGLNVAFGDIDSTEIDFIFNHKPDIFVINSNSKEEEQKNLDILKKIKDIFGEIPKTIVVEKDENQTFIEELKKLENVQFVKNVVNVADVFHILKMETRKKNIAMINIDAEEFDSLNNELKDTGFHLIYYPSCDKLIEELDESFFDIALVNVKKDTNIVDFNDKVQQKIKNIGSIYLLNDDDKLDIVEQKGYLYLTKPFETKKIIDLINNILGK